MKKFKGQVLDSMKVTLKMVFSPQIVSEKNPITFMKDPLFIINID